jgi:exodeoxyribonuclease VII large subunit
MENVLTVSEITTDIKQLLEIEFDYAAVIGEISNFKSHGSGHWYFSLKDANAQLNCAMWRGFNNRVFFTPENGMKIIAEGKITVYPPRGTYQLDVRSMKPAGEGELQAAFERLKKRLAEEGLFDEEYKKDIPSFPEKIGIVTGGKSAAVRDMITTAERRFPLAEIFFIPTKVQGDGAAEEIAANIKRLDARGDVDVIIIGRGGGSLEDLWAFNEEIVARAIFEAETPIISGVGHEIDFTIADFVADLRAATPTAAMEMATPDKGEIISYLRSFIESSGASVLNSIERKREQTRQTLYSYGFRMPGDRVKNAYQRIDHIIYALNSNVDKKMKEVKSKLNIFEKVLDGADFNKNLKKGYAIVKQNGKIIPRAEKLNKSEGMIVKFYDKEVVSRLDKNG